MSYRSSASFGKRQEYLAITELLRRGLDVYLTLVDDQQIDCVIRQEKDAELHYLDIQIKARSKDCAPRNAGTFAAMEIPKPRENYFFIFYSEQANVYWIVPSLELVREARQNKTGKNKGKYTINLCNRTKSGVTPRPKFKKYENAFHLLNWSPSNNAGSDNLARIVKPSSIEAKSIKPLKTINIHLWAEIEKLDGLILYTLKQNKCFEIRKILQDKVVIFIHSTGNERKMKREEIEGALLFLIKNGEITRSEIELNFSSRNPAYVAAIMARLPDIKSSTDPVITLKVIP